ncbi:MAG: response regulator, partial [Deltaproteobacteria bacterium]|nr:response regulator [Candidatus Tharpellaceae bacterium]
QLRQAGYTILEAENGLDALEQARNHQGKIDLLFTDVVMPIMGGNELHKKIKDIYPDIPVIFSSGYADDNLPKEMLKLSKEQFINKPYSLQDIMAKIRRLLDGS